MSGLRGKGADLTLSVTGLEQAAIGLMALTPASAWEYRENNIFVYPDDENERRTRLAWIAKKIDAGGGSGCHSFRGAASAFDRPQSGKAARRTRRSPHCCAVRTAR